MHPISERAMGRPSRLHSAARIAAMTIAAAVLSSCFSLSGPAVGSWGRGDHAPAALDGPNDPPPARVPATAADAPRRPGAAPAENKRPASPAASRTHSTEPPRNVLATKEDLADLIYRIVEATERNNTRLQKFDSEIERINFEMDHIRTSEGWEFQISDRNVDVDAHRREKRAGTSRNLDGSFRNPHDFFGPLDDKEDEFVLKLQRSFGEPDHERFVDAALKRLEKMDGIAAKQEVRRTIHLDTLDAIFQILYWHSAARLIDEKIALARRRLELIEIARQAEEALEKDLVAARNKASIAQQERDVEVLVCERILRKLRDKTGDPSLTLPTTFPLVADTDPPPKNCDEEAVTSYSIAARSDYHIALLRLELADKLQWHMAWHLPKIDFEVWWNRFSEHRRYIDEFRKDRGREFATEITINIPLNLPARGWARHKMFAAARKAIALDVEQIREMIEQDVFDTYVEWRTAYLARSRAVGAIEEARENERAVALMVQLTPEEIVGVPAVELIDAQIKVLDARIDLLKADKALLLAQAHWDYLRGDSPIDRAVAPFATKERREAEKTSWLKWWMSLIK